MNENRFYNEIMELKESDDIKDILKRWNNFSKNRMYIPQGVPILLPDMLWIAKSGYGKTNLIRLISEYLYEEKLMEFYGDVKFIETELEYCPRDREFVSFKSFMDEVVRAAGFRDEFRGIVCVDITEWIDHINENYFIDFLEYLSENTDIWHIIFVVDCSDSKKLCRLEALLGIYFRIDKVMFRLPETFELCCYIEKYFKKYGFMIDKDAVDILAETIDELRDSRYFDGYKTLNMICSDLLYRLFSAENVDSYVITSDVVRYYDKDSDYIKRTKENIEKRRKIGYISGGAGNE